MKLKYTKDICGNDILEDETGQHQVMMEWEKPYMEACIDKLDISGSVLEIGFGFGYSARRICSSPHITEYTVIECCPVVWDKVEQFSKEFPTLKINLVKGRWQDVLCTTESYDRCFFDDYIHDSNKPNRFLNFICDFLLYHSNIDCKIGAFSTQYLQYNNIPWLNMECERYMIDIPNYCKYAKGTKLYINKLTKKRNITVEEVNTLKELSKPTGLTAVDGILNISSKSTFNMVMGTPTNMKHISAFAEIENLYFSKKDTEKLDKYCDEYLQENKQDDYKQRMVKFYQGFATFHTNPLKSKEIFNSLLQIEDIEDEIKEWSLSNLSLLEI